MTLFDYSAGAIAIFMVAIGVYLVIRELRAPPVVLPEWENTLTRKEWKALVARQRR